MCGCRKEAVEKSGITIECAEKDDEPTDVLELHGIGRLWREIAAEITIEHNNK